MPIQVEHLTHTYMPGSPFAAVALHDVSLTIADGELIGLLGHTGSGKTTLVQHLNGLMKPTEGRVVVDDLDITRKGTSLLEVRKKVGLVFQYPEYQLFEETVARDIAFGPKNMGLAQAEIDERVRGACAQVGLDFQAIGERSPFELSGGQMRRVAIAGVLAMRPKILVLDEPTAGLDPAGRRGILSMIRNLHAAGGLTVIMVSHSMDDIASLATRLIVMSQGELVLSGTPREVFTQQELLKSIGLGVPQAAELAHALIAEGYPLPGDLYTLTEVREAILALAGKGAAAC
ncbi:MAG: energy-coupling factor transporter ATPase [Clostridia bacterium]